MKKNIFYCLIILFSGFSLCSQAQIITTFAGDGIPDYGGDGAAAILAQINNPGGLAIDGLGNVYLADQSNSRIRKIDRDGIITTVAGTGVSGFTADGVQATASKLFFPGGIAIDGSGNMYIADDYNYRIRKVDPSGVITTIAGTGLAGFSGDGTPATTAHISHTGGIAVDAIGNVYITELINQRVRKIDTAGIITTIAGTGTMGFFGDGAAATLAQLNIPRDVKVDNWGNVYIFDIDNYRVRKVDVSGTINTVAGTGAFGFFGDGGSATDARLNGPNGGFVDGLGNLYIADLGNHRIRKVSAAGIITTICGTGTAGFGGDDSLATDARINGPTDITLDCGGNLYFSDHSNQRVRKITYNHPPSFIWGHSIHATACQNTMLDIDSLLSALDIDTGQVIVWSIVGTPMHGVLASSSTAVSTGGPVLCTGMNYYPISDFTGYDSFKIAVTDCGHLSDTTTVYVTVSPLPFAGVIYGSDSVCAAMFPTVLVDTVASGVWGVTHGFVSITTAGIASGLSPGVDSVYYVTANSCGTDTAYFKITVIPCLTEVNPLPAPHVEAMSIVPNPNTGAFTLNVVSAAREEVDIVITNITGEKVKAFTTTANQLVNVNLEGRTGIFVITASTAHNRYIAKVMIQ